MASTAELVSVPLLLDRQTVEQHSLRREEPRWLRDARLEALQGFTPGTWPTGQEEEWRRFPLKDLPEGALVSTLDHLPGIQFKLDPQAAAQGVIFKGLLRASLDNPELVRPHLAPGEGIPSHAAFLWPAGADAMLSRTIVVAERGPTVTIVEDLSSEGATPRIAIPHVDLYAGPGARVRYVAIRRFAPGVVDFGFQRFRSANDSDVAVHNVFAGEGNSKVGIQSDIEGNGATVKLYGLVAAGDHQRIDVNSFQRLDGKSSQSDLLYLSALYDHAKAIFYGKIRVEATSSGTGSYQECRNMLLSDHAGADPIPVLEILTNDVVRCGHGATAGALGDEDLFYAMSRGFDRDQAQQLMVHGFFRRVINQLDDEHVRQRVLNALRPRIGNIAEMGVLI